MVDPLVVTAFEQEVMGYLSDLGVPCNIQVKPGSEGQLRVPFDHGHYRF